jgi:hypothetical protein
MVIVRLGAVGFGGIGGGHIAARGGIGGGGEEATDGGEVGRGAEC